MVRLHVEPAWRMRDPVSYGLRRFGFGEFIAHYPWNEHMPERLWQQLDVAG